jgi:hypothetical protein
MPMYMPWSCQGQERPSSDAPTAAARRTLGAYDHHHQPDGDRIENSFENGHVGVVIINRDEVSSATPMPMTEAKCQVKLITTPATINVQWIRNSPIRR